MKKPAALVMMAALVALAACPAWAELCPECKRKMYPMVIGKCEVCGGPTTSRAFKLCPKCSARLGQCEHCRKPLGPVLGPDANGKTIKVPLGRTVTIRLKGNPTTGYRWSLERLEGKALKQVGDVQYVAKRVPPRLVGSGGVFIATFRAVEPGKASVRMHYARPWEKGKPPAKVFELTVQVAKPPGKK